MNRKAISAFFLFVTYTTLNANTNSEIQSLVAYTASKANTNSEIQSLNDRMNELEHKVKANTQPPRPNAKNGIGVYFTAEPLYWLMTEDDLAYAATGSYILVAEPAGGIPTNYKFDLKNGKTHHPKFDWRWGFRVGTGYDLPYDGWDIFSVWTRFHQHTQDQLKRDGDPDPSNSQFSGGGQGDFISPFWVAQLFASPGLMNQAKALWKLQLDLIDLELGREYFIGKFLSLRPFIGLRNGWINQHFDLSFLTFDFANNQPTVIGRRIHVHMKNNFWGIGARGGLNTQWFLGKGISIYGNAAISFLEGHFHTRYKLHDEKPTATTKAIGIGPGGSGVLQEEPSFDDSFVNKNHVHTLVVMADLSLGLRWNKSFSDDRYYLGIWAGYEQNIFFDQNKFMNFQNDFTLLTLFSSPQESSGPNFFTNDGNLVTRGITGGLEFGF